MLLLQNAAFLTLFRDAMRARGEVRDVRIDALEAAPLATTGAAALEEIFADVSGDPMAAAGKTLTYAAGQPSPQAFIDAARVLVFLKGDNSHDYKYSSAVLEDCLNVSQPWRATFLAASVFKLRGSQGPDNALVQRTRAALA
jgi:hypothetical protein